MWTLTLHTYYNIGVNTPKQTPKYSLNNFPNSFQIDSARMLFSEQDLRSVDVCVCVRSNLKFLQLTGYCVAVSES